MVFTGVKLGQTKPREPLLKLLSVLLVKSVYKISYNRIVQNDSVWNIYSFLCRIKDPQITEQQLIKLKLHVTKLAYWKSSQHRASLEAILTAFGACFMHLRYFSLNCTVSMCLNIYLPVSSLLAIIAHSSAVRMHLRIMFGHILLQCLLSSIIRVCLHLVTLLTENSRVGIKNSLRLY